MMPPPPRQRGDVRSLSGGICPVPGNILNPFYPLAVRLKGICPHETERRIVPHVRTSPAPISASGSGSFAWAFM